MMYKRVVLVIISLLLFLTSVCHANRLDVNRWQHFANTDSAQVYCDLNSLRQNNEYILELWVCYYKPNVNPKKEIYSYYNYTINGYDRVYYTHRYYEEDGNGKEQKYNPFVRLEVLRSLGWQHYSPNSILEMAFNRYYRR